MKLKSKVVNIILFDVVFYLYLVDGSCDRCIATETHNCSSGCTACIDGCDSTNSNFENNICVEKECHERKVNNSVEWGRVCGSGNCFAPETGTNDGDACSSSCSNPKYVFFFFSVLYYYY
jgi:hypothetical protein